MSGGVPRRRKRRTRRRGAWGDGPVPPPLFFSPSVCSIVRGIPQLVSLIGVFLMWCPGRPFTATITGSRAGWLAGNPAPPLHLGSSAPTGWGAPHGGVPQGGAPLWGWWCPTLVGSHIAWGTTPRLASSDLLCAPRGPLVPAVVLSHRLAGSDRLTTTHDPAPWLPHQPWRGTTRRGPLCTTEEGSRERPTDTTRAESARALPFGSPTPALTGVAHVVPRVWSTPGVGAPCRRASTARHQGPGRTQPETHHRVSLTLQRWVTLRPAVHHTKGAPQKVEPPRPHTRGARPAEANSRRHTDHQEGTTTHGRPKRDPTKRDPTQAHHQTEPQRSRTNTTNAHHHRAANTTANSRWNPATAGLRVPPSG